MKALYHEYLKRKKAIKGRIRDFEKLKDTPYPRIFEELCFCLCTPQSKAVLADKAIYTLKEKKFLYTGSTARIKTCLKGVRFPNNKARFIKDARSTDLKKILKGDNDFEARDLMVENIKGMGYKEASHFLRNIGRGKELAILDVHILKNLCRIGVINKIPKTLTRKKYLEIEAKMRGFADKVKIPLRELDLLFWSRQTGYVFK